MPSISVPMCGDRSFRIADSTSKFGRVGSARSPGSWWSKRPISVIFSLGS